MAKTIFEQLHTEGLISDESLNNISTKSASGLFSIHWELKTLLYLGVMMLSTGLGILVYKNIDSISHQAVLASIGLISAGCYIWCYKHQAAFSRKKVETPNPLFDYILLLGALSFLSFIGYLQFQYEVFGLRYGLATFIPMLALFCTAYYFDHLGILSLAIANLAVWLGISVTPKHLLQNGDFNSERAIYTYLALGLFLLVLACLSRRYDFKQHFSFTYQNYGVHLTFISLISGYFYYQYLPSLIWFSAFAIAAWLIYKHALKERSFYFIVLTVLYSYVIISGFITNSLFLLGNASLGPVVLLYYVVSGFSLVMLLMNLNKKVKAS